MDNIRNNVRDNVPSYQFNVIPGNANQGAIFLTRKNIANPPFNQDDFIWKAMEDIIGTADVKLEYDEIENKYSIYKAKGHLDNEGNWHYTWELFGTWDALTPEVTEILKRLNYVEYIFDTSEANRLKVNGVEKDGRIVELCNLTFASKEEFDNAIDLLDNNLSDEITRAMNKENQLQSEISEEISRATNKENQLQSNISAEINRATNKEQDLQNQINDNKENLANYIDNFDTKAALDAYIGPVNNNDYAIVLDDETHNHQCWRYIYRGSSNTWAAQYMVNETPLTQAQLAAINSGIDSTKVAQVEQNRQDIANINTEIGELQEELTPGDGIDITNNIISVKANNGITLDANGVHVKPGNGINVNANGVIVRPSDGISVTSAGVAVKTGDGIKFDDSGNVIVKYSSGLQINGGSLEAKSDTSRGVQVNNNGIGVKINTTNLKFNSNGNLDTVLQIWTGTQAQYDAITTKDNNTLYLVYD